MENAAAPKPDAFVLNLASAQGYSQVSLGPDCAGIERVMTFPNSVLR